MNYDLKKEGIKLIFSIIAGILMIPLVNQVDINFYRTVFIFQMGIMLDLLFDSRKKIRLFFIIWDAVNTIISLFACAIAFSCMIPAFLDTMAKINVAQIVDIFLMVCVWSCLIRTLIEFSIMTIRSKLIGIAIYNSQI